MRNEEILYDLSHLRSMSYGNENFVKKMINIFCEQTPGIMEDMIAAVKQDDFEKIAAIAHKIRPGIDTLNIVPLIQPVRDIEDMCRNKQTDLKLTAMVNETDATMKKVIYKMKQEYPDNQ